MVAPGFGEPPFFNFDGAIVKMLSKGKSLTDSRACGVSGCVETGAFGKEAYILTGYLNLPKILEIALNNGVDSRALEKKLEPRSSSFENYDDIWKAFVTQLRHFIRIKSEGNDVIEEMYSEVPASAVSFTVDRRLREERERLQQRRDEIQHNYIQVVGLGTLADSLASLKYNVFEKKVFDQSDVLLALRSDFEGPRGHETDFPQQDSKVRKR